MKRRLGLVSLLLVVLVAPGPSPAAATPEGQLTWAVAVSLAPAWFDPAAHDGRRRDAFVRALPWRVGHLEGLIHEQAAERDRKRREATLHRIQQVMHERAMFAPIWEIAVLNGYGPRVAEPALGLIAGHLFTAPYEELRLKDR